MRVRGLAGRCILDKLEYARDRRLREALCNLNHQLAGIVDKPGKNGVARGDRTRARLSDCQVLDILADRIEEHDCHGFWQLVNHYSAQSCDTHEKHLVKYPPAKNVLHCAKQHRCPDQEICA